MEDFKCTGLLIPNYYWIYFLIWSKVCLFFCIIAYLSYNVSLLLKGEGAGEANVVFYRFDNPKPEVGLEGCNNLYILIEFLIKSFTYFCYCSSSKICSPDIYNSYFLAY